MYLLDTNILIYFFKGQGQVAEQFLSYFTNRYSD